MMVLQNVELLLVRASSGGGGASLSGFRMDTASVTSSPRGPATLVESCRCPAGYTGMSCESCAEGYQRSPGGAWLGQCVPIPEECRDGEYGDPGRGVPCRPCPCPGTPHQYGRTCYLDQDQQVTCNCPTGYQGRRCEQCAPGYRGSPTQGEPCVKGGECNPDGSLADDPDPRTGQCPCKEFSTGRLCDRCKPYAFHLGPQNLHGCIPCFCMGVTNQCSSCGWSRNQISAVFTSDAQGVTLTDDLAESDLGAIQVDPAGRRLVVTDLNQFGNQPVYWSLPAQFLGDQLTAYGGSLRFTQSYNSAEEPGAFDYYPDVEIMGNDVRLLHMVEGRVPANRAAPVQVPILETAWRRNDGGPVNREHLMMALADLDYIIIKAADASGATQATLADVELDSATPRETGQAQAHAVEECSCPAGYKGLSCEDCDVGYTRTLSGLYLRQCELCDCNGRSDECDPETGECLNCRDNTAGAQCDQCVAGYSGDPARGQPCQPDTSAALSCNCDPRGSRSAACDRRLQCACKSRAQGSRCDRCTPGSFGLGSSAAEGCSACFCSGVSTQCSEAPLHKTQIPMQVVDSQHGFTLATSDGSEASGSGDISASYAENMLSYNFQGSLDDALYWVLPDLFTGDRLTSYGGSLQWRQQINAPSSGGDPYDVILRGGGVSLGVSSQRSGGGYSVDLSAEAGWVDAQTGQTADRELLMTVLSDLESLLILAAPPFSQGRLYTSLNDVVLDTAIAADTRQGRAYGIEQCRCPYGYSGLSCQNCAAGHYQDSDGACQRCPCSGNEQECGLADDGRVQCDCKPNFSGDRCQVDTTVGDEPISPPRATISPRFLSLEVGAPAQLDCTSEGNPAPTITWAGGRSGTFEPDVNIIGGLLVIGAVRKSHEAEYTCTATNVAGSDSVRTIIYVKERARADQGGYSPDRRQPQAPPPSPPQPQPQPPSQAPSQPQPPSEPQPPSQTPSQPQPPSQPQYPSEPQPPSQPGPPSEPQPPSHSQPPSEPEPPSQSEPQFERPSSPLPGPPGSPSRGGQPPGAPGSLPSRRPGLQIDPPGPLPLQIRPQRLTAFSGDTVQLECLALDPSLSGKRSWSRARGQTLPESASVVGDTLVISSVSVYDRGGYICTVQDDRGRSTQASALIDVQEVVLPEVQVYPSAENQVSVGSSVLLQCRVLAGSPEPAVSWRRLGASGEQLEMPATAQQMPGGVLRFIRVRGDETGYYECKASNQGGEDARSASLKVVSAPVITLEQPMQYRVAAGQDVTLACSAAGVPEPSLFWESPRRSGPATSPTPARAELHLQSASSADSGVYTCRAQNAAGTTSDRLRLQVDRARAGGGRPPVPYPTRQPHYPPTPGYPQPHSPPAQPQPAHGGHDGHSAPAGGHEGHGAPPGGHSAPPGGHGASAGGHGAPAGGHDGHGAPPGGHSAPAGGHDGHSAPPGGHDGHGAPPGGHSVPAGGHGAPAGGHDGHGAPPGGHDGHGAPAGGHDGHGAPPGGHGAPAGGHDGSGGSPPEAPSHAGNIQPTSGEYVVPLDGRAELTCEVVGASSPLSISWVRSDGSPMPVDHIIRGGTLYINRVQKDAEGSYTCLGLSVSDVVVFQAEAALRVIEPPQVMLQPQRQVVRPGEQVSVYCTATGDEPITLTWSRLRGEIAASASIIEGELVFSSISVPDAGRYICTAENAAGHARGVSDVIVNDRAPAPHAEGGISISAVQSEVKGYVGSSATLRCETSGYDGGVEWKKVGASEIYRSADADDTSLTIDSLELSDSGDYQCSVRNHRGESAYAQIRLKVAQASEEASGAPSLPCLPGSYPCGSGECLPLESFCNGERDCSDGSDETQCRSHATPESHAQTAGAETEKEVAPPEEEAKHVEPDEYDEAEPVEQSYDDEVPADGDHYDDEAALDTGYDDGSEILPDEYDESHYDDGLGHEEGTKQEDDPLLYEYPEYYDYDQ